MSPLRNHPLAKYRPRGATQHSVSSLFRQWYVCSLSDDVTGSTWLWSNLWLADEGREDEWGLIRSCWENWKRQKRKAQSFPKILSQSVCQMRMKCFCAEATQRSYFNVIQFALTAADKNWVIILHCSFLNGACVNFFSTVWSQLYINRPLWKHLRMLNAKRMCQRPRGEVF